MNDNHEMIIKKNNSYTAMSNYHLRDKTLSYKAKGLLSFMLSLPETWNYSVKGLVAVSKENIKAISSTLKELEEHKYLLRIKKQSSTGRFIYKYYIYEVPYTQKGCMEEGYTEKEHQINTNIINTNNKIDKDDKTNLNNVKEFKHNYLTEELIKNKYITCDDSQVFYYDSLFEKLLGDGNEFQDLLKIVHYIVPRVVRRDFKDEDGNEIENKFGYFKNSIISNINRFHLDLDELWGDEDMELYDDYFER